MSVTTIDVLWRQLGQHPQRILTASASHDDSDLLSRIERAVAVLQQLQLQRVASRLDNGLDWLVLDLALRCIGGVHVPLPTFFSPEQVRHALASSGAQAVFIASGSVAPVSTRSTGREIDGLDLASCWLLDEADPTPLPEGTACITYTSGTTGRPKGVCLDAQTLLQVAASLAEAAEPITPRRHLCLMPLSTLLENVAGLYAALLANAQIALPSLAEIGYTGASGLDVPTLIRCLHRYQPESIILVPQLLTALVMAAEAGVALPGSLRYIAVGGGRVAPHMLARAAALGLPVFEGYGLTECASVVCLNRPQANRAGSVGRPLAHVRLEVVDGELVVHGPRALGYLGDDGLPPGPIHTGDLGHIDAEGYVHVTGRRRNVFITAFGRNVSPEWVESEVLAHPQFAQVLVWGEAQADNIALIVPRGAGVGEAHVQHALAQVNAGLPDYARIARYLPVQTPFSAGDGLLTANGRPRRDAILARYQTEIDACYRRPANVPVTGVTA